MLTRRGTGLLAAAAGLWLASRVFGAPELQIAAGAALLLLATALISLVATSTTLACERIVQPGRLAFGERGSVHLTVTNPRRRPTGQLRLRDRAPASLATPPEVSLGPLRGGGRVELSYALRGDQRGVAELGPLRVEFVDPFGLVARRRTLAGTGTVTVRPPVTVLPRGLPLAGVTSGGGEGRPQPRPGGEDLAEVREYVPGDPLKAIHWSSTAHRGKLMVRNEEGRQDPRVTVLLDLRADRHRGSGPTSSLERAVGAAASVTAHLAGRRQAVAILDRPLSTTPATRTAEAWLDHLAEVDSIPVDLRQVLAPVTSGGLLGTALIAIITPPDATDLQALVRVGRGATLRVCILVATAEPGSASNLAAAAAALRAAGWRVTTLEPGDELVERWTDLLHVRRTTAVGDTASARA